MLAWPAALLLAMRLACAAAPESPPQPPIRVLLLFPSDLLLPEALSQAEITKTAIRDAVPRDVDFYAEGLDALRLPRPEQEQEFVALLKKRYQRTPPDLIVVHGPMHGFVARYRADLWPQTPLMFAGVTEHRARSPDFPRGAPGTTVRFDPQGTIDLALRLQPDARRLIVVGGTSDYDRNQLDFVAPTLEKYRNRLTVEVLHDRSLEDVRERLIAASRDTIVLLLPMFRDAKGRVFVPADIVTQLASVSNAPTYAYYDHDIGLGVVGGSFANWAAQKPMLTAIAKELLLGGTRNESLAMQPPVPNQCTVDWRQVLRWNLRADRLPGDCVRKFREPTLWEQYRAQAVLVCLIIALQSGLILALLVQRRRRRLAEIDAHEQRTQLTHAMRVATMGELNASIAHELSQPLAAIRSNADTGRALLDSGSAADFRELREILAAIQDDNERANDIVQQLRALLRKGPQMQLLDIAAATDTAIRLVKGVARRDSVRIVSELTNVPAVNGDPKQIQQLLLNLMMNAIHAMSQVPRERRRLEVATRARQDGYIEVRITDTGPGIPPERLERIFEPFFSTRSDGLGLGLVISRSIVQAHGGSLSVDSTTGGATFRVSLPPAGSASSLR
jgi:signal transduction histidine kinase